MERNPYSIPSGTPTAAPTGATNILSGGGLDQAVPGTGLNLVCITIIDIIILTKYTNDAYYNHIYTVYQHNRASSWPSVWEA
jgi:hypothetical protein